MEDTKAMLIRVFLTAFSFLFSVLGHPKSFY